MKTYIKWNFHIKRKKMTSLWFWNQCLLLLKKASRLFLSGVVQICRVIISFNLQDINHVISGAPWCDINLSRRSRTHAYFCAELWVEPFCPRLPSPLGHFIRGVYGAAYFILGKCVLLTQQMGFTLAKPALDFFLYNTQFTTGDYMEWLLFLINGR
jgi:hypothetical protein